MKYSHYNSVINISGRHTLIYNSLAEKFIVFKNRSVRLDDGGARVDEKDVGMPDFSRMAEAGVIVEDDIDEPKKLLNLISEMEDNRDEYILHINPTLDCNFRCWYCYENHLHGSIMSGNTIRATQSFISRLLDSRPGIKALHIGFFGGEPLLYFNDTVRPILQYAKSLTESHGVRLTCNFTTNGSLVREDHISFLKDFCASFQITLDGGRESHDKVRFHKGGRGSYDDILSAVTRLAESGAGIILRINFTSANLESVAGICEDLRDIPEAVRQNIRIDLQRVWQDRPMGKDDTEARAMETRRMFTRTGFHVIPNYIPSHVKYPCYGDKKNHVLINHDGRLYGCTARDFNEPNSIGHLSETGELVFDRNVYERRLNAKMAKAICRTCRIAPVCGGGCRQRAMESAGADECVFNYSEKDKDDIVLDIFEHLYCR